MKELLDLVSLLFAIVGWAAVLIACLVLVVCAAIGICNHCWDAAVERHYARRRAEIAARAASDG